MKLPHSQDLHLTVWHSSFGLVTAFKAWCRDTWFETHLRMAARCDELIFYTHRLSDEKPQFLVPKWTHQSKMSNV
jgi:hypothetical protein